MEAKRSMTTSKDEYEAESEKQRRWLEECAKIGKVRYRKFVKAMKRLGCEHHILKCPWTRKVTIQEVLEEVLKVVDEEQEQGGSVPDPDREYWTYLTVRKELGSFRTGYCPTGYAIVGFEYKIKDAVGVLGGGDLFHEAVTPEAVFEVFDDETKALVCLNEVWYYLGLTREIVVQKLSPQKEKEKPTTWSLNPCSAQAPAPTMTGFWSQVPTHAPPDGPGLPPRQLHRHERLIIADNLRKKHALYCAQYYAKHGMEIPNNKFQQSEFMEEQKEIRKMLQKISDDHYRTFLTALRRLGGEDDSHNPNVTPQALYPLIMEQVAATGYDDGFWTWTMSEVEKHLRQYQAGLHYMWSAYHHNAMLKAIADLGEDNMFNEERVTPKAVMELMERDVVTNIHAVKFNFQMLREALKKDPIDLLRYPRDVDMNLGFGYSSTMFQAVRALYCPNN